MSEAFEINERNQVVPYTSGRKCTDTRAWRDATELELQQQEQIEQLEREIAEAQKQRDTLINILTDVINEDGTAKSIDRASIFLTAVKGASHE